MSVNGITNNVPSTQSTYQSQSSNNSSAASTAENTTAASEAAVYEPSEAAKKYVPDKELIAKLKADSNQRQADLMNLVRDMLSKQANKYGQANDIWKLLSSGNFEVDAATKSKAQADIVADGYWGVEQTSDRMVEFAKALSGGDPAKADEMLEAFKKGYKMAEKTWGGKLPDISQQTYDAVLKKFDAWKNGLEDGVTQ